MKDSKTFMWIVENTANHPWLKGYDAAIIELFSHGETEIRKYIIDGHGTLWFPSVEGSAKPAKPLGKLLSVTLADCDDDTRKRAIEFSGLEGKSVLFLPANHEA